MRICNFLEYLEFFGVWDFLEPLEFLRFLEFVEYFAILIFLDLHGVEFLRIFANIWEYLQYSGIFGIFGVI